MDPLTIAAVAVVLAITGVAVAWRMHRRASRAEAEIANLRARHERRDLGHELPPNQRPWRLVDSGPRRRANPP